MENRGNAERSDCVRADRQNNSFTPGKYFVDVVVKIEKPELLKHSSVGLFVSYRSTFSLPRSTSAFITKVKVNDLQRNLVNLFSFSSTLGQPETSPVIHANVRQLSYPDGERWNGISLISNNMTTVI